MKEEIKYNLVNYINTNNKTPKILSIFIIFMLLIVILFSSVCNVYNIEKLNANTICENNICVLNFYNYGIEKEEYQFIKIKDKKYTIENLSFSAPVLDNTNTIFQEVKINLANYKGSNNEIVEIEIYKNKEKLIKKIFKIIVER